MVVGICGFGNTGASAVVDYLKEFENITFFDDFEFQLLHQPDGINDLKYHLVRNKERITCNVAINRFIRLCKKSRIGQKFKKKIGKKFTEWYTNYINDLILVSWKGENSSFDPIDLSHRPSGWLHDFFILADKVLRKINPRFHLFPYRKKYFSIISDEAFDSITKKYLKKLFALLDIDNKNISVVDMLFSSTNTDLGMEFFEDAKAIVVVRDPRDVFVSAKLCPQDSRFMPNDNSKKFCIYYKTLMDNISPKNSLLILQYEDLIYKYRETTDKIKKFLKIENSPIDEYKYFNPKISIKYTNRIKLYQKYTKDIKIIEEELKSYLYNFDCKQASEL